METADGKSVQMVKWKVQSATADWRQGPTTGGTATLVCVHSVDRFARIPSEIVSMLFRDSIPTVDELAKESRPEAQ